MSQVFIELTGDGKLEVPVAHTLGAELYSSLSSGGNITTISITDGYSVEKTNSDNEIGLNAVTFLRSSNVGSGKKISVSFTASNITGSEVFTHYYDDGYKPLPSNHTVVNGLNELVLDERVDGGSNYSLSNESADNFTFDITFISVKEIQSVEGTMLYYDADAGKHVQIGGDSGLGNTMPELIVNGDFSDGDTGWATSSSTISVISEVATVTATASSNSSIRKGASVINGSRYRCSADLESDIANITPESARLRVADVVDPVVLAVSDSGVPETISGVVTSSSTSITLRIEVASITAWGAVGDSLRVDNVSLKQILALSTVKTFQNQKIGHFVSLSAGQYFSPEDIVKLNADYDLLRRWAYDETGTGAGLSIIKKPQDYYYYIVAGADNVVGLPLIPPYAYIIVVDDPKPTGGSFATRAKALANRLIGKFGENVMLIYSQDGVYDPSQGEEVASKLYYEMKGKVTNYSLSEVDNENVLVDDLLLIVQTEVVITKDWAVQYNSFEWNVVGIEKVVTQDTTIIYKLQIRKSSTV